MIFSTLDGIVRRTLLERSMPLHYYLEYLLHASTCLREMSFDTLQIVRTVALPVNSYFAVDLPGDFTDDVGLAIPIGGLLHPVTKRDGITPLRSHDSTGNFIPWPLLSDQTDQNFFGFNTSWLYYWNINDYGEPTGRYFGSPGQGKLNSYKLVKERRQIQLPNTFTSSTVVLTYISDGQSADNATQIETWAIRSIQTYIDWQTSPSAKIKDSGEARTFYNEKRKCRARTDDLTSDDVKTIIRRHYFAAIKN